MNTVPISSLKYPFILILLIISLLGVFPLSAQSTSIPFNDDGKSRYLVLDKPGKIKRLRFFIGDNITFRFKDDSHIYSGIITHIFPHAIVVKEAVVPLSDIDRIYYEKKGYGANILRGWATISKVNGIAFTVIGAIIMMTPASSFGYNQGADVALGGLTICTSGQLAKLATKRKYKIGRRRTLKVIEGAHPQAK